MRDSGCACVFTSQQVMDYHMPADLCVFFSVCALHAKSVFQVPRR